MVSHAPDPYMGPDGVLANVPGIKRPAVLRAFEYANTSFRLAELRQTPVDGQFDLAHLCAIHAYAFRAVYAWAGEPRIVNLSKGTSSFERAASVESRAAELAAGLKADGYLRGLAKPDFVDRFTRHYADWNALHPFREGNGRVTRALFDQLATQAGYTLDPKRIEADRDGWNAASQASMRGDLAPLRAIFAEALRPTRSIAFETLPPDQAVAKHPELSRYYAWLDQMLTSVAKHHPGNQQAQDYYATAARKEVTRLLDQGGDAARIRAAPPVDRGQER